MLVLTQVSLRRGVKLVLDRTSLTIQPGEKVGLVGRNGAGKSSLFSLLADRLHADAGDVSVPPRWRIGEVAQEMPETDQGATDFVLAGDTALAEAEAELARAEASDDGHAMAHAHEAIKLAGGFDARPRAQAMLLGLGFKVAELDAPVSSFSGGWRMRLQLARALMCPADLMLLDEPTNHLDLDALVWLEAWLQRYAGTMIVISHDREFLDAVTKVTVHLDETKLVRYTGNYTAFEEMRSIRLEQAQASFEKQKERMAHLQKFIDRFKAKASKAKQAQSRVKALARMEKLAPVLTSADFQFEFQEPQSLPNPMLAFADVSCGYPGEGGAGAKRIVDHIDRSVLAGQRIGILGANGQGKSTFVKTIAGDLAPPRRRDRRRQGLDDRLLRAAGARRPLARRRPADAPGSARARRRPDRARAGAARLPRLVPLHRRDGAAAGRHALGRREGAPGPGDAGLAAAEPAVARRADQPPRPDDARGAQHGAQRVRRHGHAGEPRPRPAARGVRRVLARHRRRPEAVRRRPRRLPALAARPGEGGRARGTARRGAGRSRRAPTRRTANAARSARPPTPAAPSARASQRLRRRQKPHRAPIARPRPPRASSAPTPPSR